MCLVLVTSLQFVVGKSYGRGLPQKNIDSGLVTTATSSVAGTRIYKPNICGESSNPCRAESG